MALKLSTGLRDKMLGNNATVSKVLVATTGTISFVDGGAGNDTITHSGTGFITAGFAKGDYISVRGATDSGNNAITGVKLVDAAAGTLTVATGTVTGRSGDTSAAIVISGAANGGSLRELLRNGYIKIYTSPRPASANDDDTGTMLVQITSDGTAYTYNSGNPTNGLELADASSGAVTKSGTQTWSGSAAATGTAYWGRFYPCQDPSSAEVASTSVPRFDFSVSTSGADCNLSSVNITQGATITLDSFSVTLPSGE